MITTTLQGGTTVQKLYEREGLELPVKRPVQHRAGVPVRIFLLAATTEAAAA
ncbi:hypothetical protein [Rhodococcus sp. UNC363MFTsu5.1]|uniref:hypothetical protein n=1 Tax=Rhodococcus sp. UNC363MFTsu5.1 TaxID=1449069 RepID=UPI000AEBC2D6|nr:hypothetical protein [Rhodococcus sp. UNC363MFTsu5.1]